MNNIKHLVIKLCTAAVCSALAHTAIADPVDTATLTRIRDAAMSSNYPYDRLEELSDQIGPRLSGSPGAEAAVAMIADDMRSIGMQVTLQPAKVPHWVRGIETAELVDYAKRPAGVTQKVVLTALGGSGSTPAQGLTLPVLVVHSMDELNAHAAEVKGRIVLFDVAFDPHLAETAWQAMPMAKPACTGLSDRLLQQNWALLLRWYAPSENLTSVSLTPAQRSGAKMSSPFQPPL